MSSRKKVKMLYHSHCGDFINTAFVLRLDDILLYITPWRWPDRAETGRSTYEYIIKYKKKYIRWRLLFT
jgi:hypothetical protein